METYQRILRRLAIRDDMFIKNVLADEEANPVAASLDEKTHAFARLAAPPHLRGGRDHSET